MAGYSVHDTALVNAGARIGDGTRIWYFSHVCAGAVMGSDCSLGQDIYVGNRLVIGNSVKIQNNVSVYDNVTLEDDVFCGPSMVFTNVINPGSAMSHKDEHLDTRVRRGATLGANCTIVCGVTIGRYALIGAGAVVTRYVPDFALMTSVPARHTRWMSRNGQRLERPLQGEASATRAATGERYRLVDGVCSPEGEQATFCCSGSTRTIVLSGGAPSISSTFLSDPGQLVFQSVVDCQVRLCRRVSLRESSSSAVRVMSSRN